MWFTYRRVRNTARCRLYLICPILFVSFVFVWYDILQTQQLLRATYSDKLLDKVDVSSEKRLEDASVLSLKVEAPPEVPVDASVLNNRTVSGGEVSRLKEENKEITTPLTLNKLDRIQTVHPALPSNREEWSNVKLLIYMTTHLSKQHISFLPCWNDAIQRLPIFKFADLMLYTAVLPSKKVLKQLSPFRKIIVKLYNNTEKQAGAIGAMKDPFLDYSTSHTTWFDEYDWVIRLNPDVLIRHDDWLIETMLNDTVDGIFHECYYETRKWYKIHSDFYAFRPRAINPDTFLSINPAEYQSNAERHITLGFQNIYESGRMTFVKDATYDSVYGMCRIGGINSPIIHHHKIVAACPYYYNYTIPRVDTKLVIQEKKTIQTKRQQVKQEKK